MEKGGERESEKTICIQHNAAVKFSPFMIVNSQLLLQSGEGIRMFLAVNFECVCVLSDTKWHFNYTIASFLGLPCFFLFSVQGKVWAHSSREWTWSGRRGGGGRYSNMYKQSLKASFLLIKMSSFNHANVWSQELLVDCSNGWSNVLFLQLPHFTSTWHHSRD